MRQLLASTLTAIVLGTSVVPCTAAGRAGGARAQLPLRPEPAALGGAVFYVDDDAPGDPAPGDGVVSDPLEDGSAPHPFDQIQEALELCTVADAVQIAAGLYAEALNLHSNGCHLVGAGTSPTILQALGGDLLTIGPYNPAPSLNLSLEQLTLRGGTVSISQGTENYLEPSTVLLKDLNIVACDLVFRSEGGVLPTTMKRVAMDGGSVSLIQLGPGAGTLVTASEVVAPGTIAYLDAHPDAGSSFDASDSVFAGIVLAPLSWHTSVSLHHVELIGGGIVAADMGLGQSIEADHVDFQGAGITASVGQFDWAGFISLVATNSHFTNEGISLNAIGSRISANVTNSVFDGAGISVRARYPSPGLPPEQGYVGLNVASSFFLGEGIHTAITRGSGTADVIAPLSVLNNVFRENETGLDVQYGMEFYDPTEPAGALSARMDIVNNTFVSSRTAVRVSAEADTTGLDSISALIKNNIIAGGMVGIEVSGLRNHTLIVENNDVQARPDGRYRGDLPDQTGLNGNISLPPWFKGPNDFRLQSISPCIDRGGFGSEVPLFDFSGRPRPLDGNGDGYLAPDMGAYEFPGLPDGGRTRKQ